MRLPPSGRLHLGNIFTAMLAWLSAKSAGGRILLRIEDLDKERCPKGSVETLLDDLRWFGFTFDGDILFQSERGDIYGGLLKKLEKLIYPCYCSRAQLHAATAPHGDAPIYSGRCRNLPPDERPDKNPCPAPFGAPIKPLNLRISCRANTRRTLKLGMRRLYCTKSRRSLRISACRSRRRRA